MAGEHTGLIRTCVQTTKSLAVVSTNVSSAKPKWYKSPKVFDPSFPSTIVRPRSPEATGWGKGTLDSFAPSKQTAKPLVISANVMSSAKLKGVSLPKVRNANKREIFINCFKEN